MTNLSFITTINIVRKQSGLRPLRASGKYTNGAYDLEKGAKIQYGEKLGFYARNVIATSAYFNNYQAEQLARGNVKPLFRVVFVKQTANGYTLDDVILRYGDEQIYESEQGQEYGDINVVNELNEDILYGKRRINETFSQEIDIRRLK